MVGYNISIISTKLFLHSNDVEHALYMGMSSVLLACMHSSVMSLSFSLDTTSGIYTAVNRFITLTEFNSPANKPLGSYPLG